jgi:surfactin synthase thioesterase subunit
VRSGVPQDLDALPVAFGDNGQFRIAIHAVRGINQLAVQLPGKGRARQPLTDRLCATSATVTGPGKLFTEPSGRRMFGMGAL